MPQGSILGTIILIIYINDLIHVSANLKNIMFADDTNLFLTGKSLADVEDKLVCSGSVVVTAYDSESSRPGSNPE